MAELHLDAPKTALVLIDLQNAVVGRTIAPHSAEQVITNCRTMAEALRARGGLVVYIRVDLNDFLHLPVDQPPAFGGAQPFPAALSEIVASAGFLEGDLLITKRHWGAFAGTDLERQLRQRGIETVVIAGVSTNIGVESAVRQGTGLGFGFVVVGDACSALDAEEHQFSLQRILPRLARIRTTDEVLAALA